MAPRRPAGIVGVRLVWYPVALVPIVLLAAAGFEGWLPVIVAPIALFLSFFWIFSFGFAIYAKLRQPKDLRQ